MVRMPPRSWASCQVYSGSASTSGMWTIAASSATRPARVPRPGEIGCALTNSSNSREKPWFAAKRYTSPSRRKMKAVSASHSRAADSTSVSSTGCRSKVERLMTLSTSAVAVCCCRDSVSSCVRSSTFRSRPA